MARALRGMVLMAAVALAPSARAGESVDNRIAQELFEAGAQHYDAGEYGVALVEFEAARRVKAVPALDYNIARCHEQLGHVSEAIRSYHAYLASNPSLSADGGAREHVARLEAAQPSSPPRPRATDAQRRRTAIGVSAAVAGVALASLGVGLGLYVDAGHEFELLRARGCGSAFDCGPTRWSGFQQQERVGVGLLVTGGVLAVIDVALWGGWARRELRRVRPITLVQGDALAGLGAAAAVRE